MSEDEVPPPEAPHPPKLESIGHKNPPRPYMPSKRRGPHGRFMVTQEEYERMVDVFIKGDRTAAQVAREVGCTEKTARKAVKRGWPENKWPSLEMRAEMWDAMQRAATGSQNPARAREAQSWIVLREQYLDLSMGIRSVLAKAVLVLLRNVESAVATEIKPVRQVHYEEVLDAAGNVVRRIPRTLTVDVTTAPSIHALSTSIGQVATALARTGGGEIEFANAKEPKGDPGKRRHNLTLQQVEYMAANQGRLPPGTSLDLLGDYFSA